MPWPLPNLCFPCLDRQWTRAAVWSGVGALLALTGLTHSYTLTGRDTVINLPRASEDELA